MITSKSNLYIVQDSQRYAIPTSYHLTRSINYKITNEEQAVIYIVSINKPIDTNVFKVVGMDLPVGMTIMGDALPDGPVVWNGNELVPSQLENFKQLVTEVKVQQDVGNRPQYFRIAAVAGTVLVFVLALWLYLHRRAAKLKSGLPT